VGLATRYYFLPECCCLKFAVLFLWGTPSDERTGLQFAVKVTEWSESRITRNHTLLPYLRLPQPGGPRSRIYIPQEQGGPVIPPSTEFPLRRLLRLAGLRWRYSNPPRIYILQEQDGPVQSQSPVKTNGQSISKSWRLVHSALRGSIRKISIRHQEV
jgi:hypothetical protein